MTAPPSDGPHRRSLTTTLAEHWRISTFRLAVAFGFLFMLGNIALLGLIYWQTSSYLVRRIDGSIYTMADSFRQVDPARVANRISDALAYDLRKSNIYGLFSPDGKTLAGNLRFLPSGLPVDGKIHQFAEPGIPGYRPEGAASPADGGLARAIAWRLSNGAILVVGRDFTQLEEIKAIILDASLVSGALIIGLGLLGGFALSIRPLRRIDAIRDTSRRIVQGELGLRMPVSRRQDELDMLAATVNSMLDEIERLLTEVKSVTDTLAHDLRTPLTRIRLLLYRLQQRSAIDGTQRRLLDLALTETDSLLGRFRALLRISEIENRQRKAGFGTVDPRAVVDEIAELFDALAEDKGVRFEVHCEPTRTIQADPDLLLEALSNLVDNAIKFTPAGGSVAIKLSQAEGVPVIDVIDSGCGVKAGEREAVLQRFYRGDRHRGDEGYGLGLSIVAAIIRLHGFALEFRESKIGTHIRVVCIKNV